MREPPLLSDLLTLRLALGDKDGGPPPGNNIDWVRVGTYSPSQPPASEPDVGTRIVDAPSPQNKVITDDTTSFRAIDPVLANPLTLLRDLGVLPRSTESSPPLRLAQRPPNPPPRYPRLRRHARQRHSRLYEKPPRQIQPRQQGRSGRSREPWRHRRCRSPEGTGPRPYSNHYQRASAGAGVDAEDRRIVSPGGVRNNEYVGRSAESLNIHRTGCLRRHRLEQYSVLGIQMNWTYPSLFILLCPWSALAQAPPPVLLHIEDCVPAPQAAWSRQRGNWPAWDGYIVLCPVKAAGGRIVLNILTIDIELFARDHVGSAVSPNPSGPIPNALVLDPRLTLLGLLNTPLGRGFPGHTVLEFTDWHQDLPWRIDARHFNAGFAGNYDERPLIWNPSAHHYEPRPQ